MDGVCSETHIDNVQCLINAGLDVEAEAGIHLSRHLAWHNLQDLAAELHEQRIQSRINLLVDVLAVLLAISDSIVNQLCIFGLL